MPLVPALLQALMAHDLINDKLRMVLLGAAPCPAPLVAQARERGIEVHCGYGLTETSSGVALSLGDDTDALAVCPADEVRISDSGEVLVSSRLCMMEGYYGDGARTERVLKDDVLHTGDEGWIDSAGCLHVAGRISNVVTLGSGMKVNLDEYEQAARTALNEDDVDSLGFIYVLTALEGEYDSEVPDDAWRDIHTLSDLARAILRYRKEG